VSILQAAPRVLGRVTEPVLQGAHASDATLVRPHSRENDGAQNAAHVAGCLLHVSVAGALATFLLWWRPAWSVSRPHDGGRVAPSEGLAEQRVIGESGSLQRNPETQQPRARRRRAVMARAGVNRELSFSLCARCHSCHTVRRRRLGADDASAQPRCYPLECRAADQCGVAGRCVAGASAGAGNS
jgi:hypothetical protein